MALEEGFATIRPRALLWRSSLAVPASKEVPCVLSGSSPWPRWSLSPPAQFSSSSALAAQTPEPDPTVVTRLVAEPAELSLRVGETVPLSVTAYDAAGAVVDIPIRVSAPRRAMRIRDGNLEAFEAGQYDVRAMVVMPASGAPVAELTIPW